MLSVQFISYEHYLFNYKYFSELVKGSTGSDIITRIASSSKPNSKNKDNIGLVNTIEQNFFKTGKSAGTTQKTSNNGIISQKNLLGLLALSQAYNSKTGKWMFSVPEKSTGEGGAFIAADYVEHGNIKFVATTTNNN
jgi:hypothetical protein